MPFISVNGARLHYQTYGEARPGQPPIVLVHGAINTGQVDWGGMAPRLARAGHHVIVPDCRGHGQSENPHLSYSFAEMATDTAALIAALGAPVGVERAHLIGHSNGGNVALVTLIEHPNCIETCIIQAGNAFVSPDLVEKEPPLFDPDRVAREAPDWMESMQAMHGPWHGTDYWRDLLRLTVNAIISEPNYTPADLATVRRRVLVIQGANDGVNAAGRHAQYIAENILDAELWLVEGVGHTVHGERPDEWLERVRGFLARRGPTGRAA